MFINMFNKDRGLLPFIALMSLFFVVFFGISVSAMQQRNLGQREEIVIGHGFGAESAAESGEIQWLYWKNEVCPDYKNMYASEKDAREDFNNLSNEHVDISYFIKNGDLDGVKMKCKLKGFDVNKKSVLGKETPLNLALAVGKIDIVNLLVKDFGAQFDNDSIKFIQKPVIQKPVEGPKKIEKKEIVEKKKEIVEEEDVCPSCLEELTDSKEHGKIVRLKCQGRHRIHEGCIKKWWEGKGPEQKTCPMCMEVIKNK